MSEIINFENNKYEWQDINGQRCLVPYKEEENPLKGMEDGDRFIYKPDDRLYEVRHIHMNGKKLYFLAHDGITKWNNGNAWEVVEDSLEALVENLWIKQKEWSKQLKKVKVRTSWEYVK